MRLASAPAPLANGLVTKAELRAQIVAALRDVAGGATQRQADSEAICRAIRQHPVWTTAHLVCGFLPLPSEPQISALWDEERAFCFPRVRDGVVELIRLEHPEVRRRATWKLDTVEHDRAPIVAPAEVDLFLVPGLAFTRDGRRLGRGGGFYDRLLPQRKMQSTAIGVCFASQVVADIPCEPHDQKVDEIVSG